MADNKLLDKLKYKDNYRFLVTNPPENFLNRLQGINFALHPEGDKYAIALVFVATQLEILNYVDTIISSTEDNCIMWFAYPKLSGQIKSDITRDKGWDILHKKGFCPVSQISIDDTWSALRFRRYKYVGHPKNE
jgi:hypothetical protein